MGLSNISRVCLALFLASAITPVFAADPPVPRSNVSATLNPTTGYYSSTNSTVRLPSGVSASPSSGLPVVSRYAGGLQQTIPTGVTINALKQTAPLPAVVRASTSAVKGAATRCLTSAKCNVGLMLAGAGLNQLLSGIGWVMNEGGQIQQVSTVASTAADGGAMWCDDSTRYCAGSPSAVVSLINSTSCPNYGCPYTLKGQQSSTYATFSNGVGGTGGISRSGAACPPPFAFNVDFHCVQTTSSPVNSDDIASGVANNYNPDPTDWPAITPQLPLDDVQIGTPPSFQGDPVTTTEKDSQGNPKKITEKTIHFEFDVKDNPSPQPSLDLKINEDTKTFEDGALTGSTTTSSTVPANPAGTGGTPAPELDIPTDCDFMPTVCAFLEWYKDDDLGDDPDLRSIMKDDEDFAKTKVISFGAAVCPQPYTIQISSLSMSVDLSFEFFCQFAEYARALVLAAAYIFAAYISLGVARG